MDWHARFLQQAGWTRDLRSYLFDRAGMTNARAVFEPGCGTGAILSDLNTSSSVFGLDFDPARISEAQIHAPTSLLTCGNVQHLPYPDGSFDITFCHYFLLWVRDPLKALHEMKRVTRLGGAVLALAEPDYESRVDKPTSLAPLGRWQAESLRRQGADPGLGVRLADLFAQAGIKIIESGPMIEGGSHALLPDDWELEWAVLEADVSGIVPREEIYEMKILDEQAWREGTRVLHVPTYFAYGMV